MYLLVDQSQNIVLGSQGCLFKLRYGPQKHLNQIKDLFLPLILGLALLSSPPEVASIISGGRVYCEGPRSILVLSAGVRIVIWFLLPDLVRSPYRSKTHSLVLYILFFTIHAHLDGVSC